MPNYPTPTGPSLTKNFYPNFIDIIKASEKILKKKITIPKANLDEIEIHDIPYTNYTGPFLMNKKVFVIGSSSFSGSWFVKTLIENKFNVTGISRSKIKKSFCFLMKKNIIFFNLI